MNTNIKSQKRIRRHKKIRSTVKGTAELPRLAVFRSNSHMYVQAIDDAKSTTLAQASDIKVTSGTKTERAIAIGKEIAATLVKGGVTKIVFDRGGFRYTGRVKALADAAREGGLNF